MEKHIRGCIFTLRETTLEGGNDGKERNTYPPHTPTKRQRGNRFIKYLFVYSGIIRNKINEGMKTLSERIKPEVKEIFEVESNRFPSILRGVIEELDSRYWVSDLTLGCVSTIASISGLQDYLKVKYQDMYMLENLNSMFEAHELIKE